MYRDDGIFDHLFSKKTVIGVEKALSKLNQETLLNNAFHTII